MALLFRLPKQIPVDDSGTPYPSCTAQFLLTGTSTETDSYSDADLTTPHANPVVADANGVLPPIYLDPLVDYKLTLRESDSTLIYTVDPVQDEITSVGYETVAKSGNYTVVSGDKDKIIKVTAAATITLPAVEDGFRVIVVNATSASVVEVITASSATLVNPDTTATESVFLSRSTSSMFSCNGTEWISHNMGSSQASQTGSLTGFASAGTPTVMMKRSGSRVTLYIETVTTDTSDATSMTLTSFAVAPHLPATTILVPSLIVDNGTQALGLASIASGGTITFGVDASGTGGFTASGTKGLPAGWSISYDVV